MGQVNANLQQVQSTDYHDYYFNASNAYFYLLVTKLELKVVYK